MVLKTAIDIAVDICYRLQPFCDVINIAGSVRRRKMVVKDIEIVCLPKVTIDKDLFGVPVGTTRVQQFGEIVMSLGTVLKGNTNGKYMQIELPQGVNLDLFIPDDFDYYRQLAIRTGSAEYANIVIAGGWRKIGWCGSDVGLRKISDCVESKTPDGKSKWKCVKKNAALPPHWKSEQEFFDWICVKMIDPTKRTFQ